MLINSHCHLDRLDLTPYQGDLSLALQAAEALDVKHFLCVCVELEHFPHITAIAERYPQVQTTVGLHPTEQVAEEPTAEQLIELGKHPKVVGVGETGLDYYRCEGDVEWQRQRFRNHIRAARVLQKPLIIHSRMAREDTLAILKQEHAETVGGVLHCFTESWEMAKEAMDDLGFYISFSGIVTFKNAVELQDIARKMPLERMLVETDSPYLAPVPYRGKPNEPAYVRYVAESLAVLKNTDLATIANNTTANFFQLFGNKSI